MDGSRTLAATALSLWWSSAACGGSSKPDPGSVGSARVAADGEDSPAEADIKMGHAAIAAAHDLTGEACLDFSQLKLEELPSLPKTPYTDTFERVWRIVLEKHYDPTIACVNWPAKRLEYGHKLTEVVDPAGAYAVMNDLLDELGQSHFGIVPPEDRLVEGDGGPGQPPFRVRWIDDQAIVVGSDVPVVPPGSAISMIGQQPITELADKAKKRAERPAELAFQIRRAVEARLACKPGSQVALTILDPKRNDARVRRNVGCRLPDGELVTLGNLENVPTRVEHRRILTDASGKALARRVGYLAFNIWMLPMVQRVEAALAELRQQGIDALVLDLRGNPGGVGPMSVPVARMLLGQKATLGTMRFREFSNEFNVQAADDPFMGPVFVLVDEGTASTSEIFAAGMRELGRVRIVGGGPSAGAALPSLIEELPGGAILQYVVGDYHSPGGTIVEGKGVPPDILVDEDRDDFIAGRDPVLDAAVAAAQNQRGE